MNEKLIGGYKMKWYKFLVNVGLYINAALWLLMGAYSMFSPIVLYTKAYNLNAAMVAIVVVSALCGMALVMGPFIGMALITRSYLKDLRKSAPAYLYALSVMHIIITLILVSGAVQNMPSSIFGIILSVILVAGEIVGLILNFLYFSARRKIFANEEKTLKWHGFLKGALFIVAVVGGLSVAVVEIGLIAVAVANASTLGFFGIVLKIIEGTVKNLVFFATLPYFAWYASKNLKNFKKEAPGNVYLVHIWNIILFLILCIVAYISKAVAILSMASLVLVILFVYMCVVLAMNYVYFEKRESIYCNE